MHFIGKSFIFYEGEGVFHHLTDNSSWSCNKRSKIQKRYLAEKLRHVTCK